MEQGNHHESAGNNLAKDQIDIGFVLMPMIKMLSNHQLSWSQREQIASAMLQTMRHHKSMVDEVQCNAASSQQSTTGNVRPIVVGEVSRRVDVAVHAMDSAIIAAIDSAKDSGVPQGLIVGLLHGYAHYQTASMMDDA